MYDIAKTLIRHIKKNKKEGDFFTNTICDVITEFYFLNFEIIFKQMKYEKTSDINELFQHVKKHKKHIKNRMALENLLLILNTRNAKSVNDIYKIALNDLTVPFSFHINISSYLNKPFIAKSIQFCKDENIDINNHSEDEYHLFLFNCTNGEIA